ncbi:MAG: hypothetical protein J5719_00225 [Bacteroidales bacterium]|nr:hypothetical protein [Bacteroidales bacterium]
MKKLFLLAAACCFLFASCCNCNKDKAEAKECEKQECAMKKGDMPCCKEMTEEQKAECEAWKNFDSLTAEEQEALVNKKKEAIDQMKAEKEAREKEMAEKKAAFEAKWANWDQLTTAEKKALLDEMPCCHKPCMGPKGPHGDMKCGMDKAPCCKGQCDKCCKDGCDKCCKEGKCEKPCCK